jgi:anti-sigma B factor antagonist
LSLQITRRRAGHAYVLNLRGRIIIGDSSQSLDRELRQLVADGANKVLLDLGEVTQIDSSGIGVIVRTFVTLRREDKKFALASPAGYVLEVLKVTNLIHSIPTFGSEAEALSAFQAEI